MQKKMAEVKRQLESAVFEVTSSDGTLKLSMSATGDVKSVALNIDFKTVNKIELESSLRDTYNRALSRSHEIAAQKMKDVSGFDIPGLK